MSLPRQGIPVPDPPAVTRLLDTARSYRRLAASLRQTHPPRRARSCRGEVDVAPDGRVLALRLLPAGASTAGPTLARHLMALYRLLVAGDLVPGDAVAEVDEVQVVDLPPESSPHPRPGPATFPPGVDDLAAPDVALAQLRARLRRRWAAAEAGALRWDDLVGEGTSADGDIVVRLGGIGLLESLNVASRASAMPVDELNAALDEALSGAFEQLRAALDAALDRIDPAVGGHPGEELR